jgi:hypothetical protein
MVVTRLDKVPMKDLLEKFDLKTQSVIEERMKKLEASHVVCFENLQMDSSAFGARTALMVGPTCTYKTVDEIREHRMGELPSVFQYPTCYAEVK